MPLRSNVYSRRTTIESVVHLAAQAGVRHSITHPQDYIDSNLTGFLNMLQAVRERPVRHFVYASSSSVYGGNTKLPFSESDRVDRPVSLYAATKRANEQMAHVYSWQFGVPATGLRFFTVYGPWGRPDMATFRFTKAIVAGEPIDVYNHGDMRRDFTYVDDIVKGVVTVLDRVPAKDADGVPHRVYNIGNHRSEPLLRFIEVLVGRAGKEGRDAALADADGRREGNVCGHRQAFARLWVGAYDDYRCGAASLR